MHNSFVGCFGLERTLKRFQVSTTTHLYIRVILCINETYLDIIDSSLGKLRLLLSSVKFLGAKEFHLQWKGCKIKHKTIDLNK